MKSHVMKVCNFARVVWAALGIGGGFTYHESMKEWLTFVLEFKQMEFDAMLMLLWVLWTNRNTLQRWLALSDGWFKLNVGVAAKVKVGVGGAMRVELMTLRDGLLLARNVGCHHV
ncbi:hypothetical protein COP2_028582 [Malus domestica]